MSETLKLSFDLSLINELKQSMGLLIHEEENNSSGKNQVKLAKKWKTSPPGTVVNSAICLKLSEDQEPAQVCVSVWHSVQQDCHHDQLQPGKYAGCCFYTFAFNSAGRR